MIRIIEADRLDWDYNVPKNVIFEYRNGENCPICQDNGIKSWISPYLVANVPSEKLIPIINKYFGVLLNNDIVNEHKTHIFCKHQADDEVREKVEKEMRMIESDLPSKVNEDYLLESSLRSLYNRKLEMDSKGEYGKEYVMLIQQITKMIELKKKIKMQIPDSITVSLKDLIKVGMDNESITNSKSNSEPRAAPIIRDGTKENIESVVRGQPKTT